MEYNERMKALGAAIKEGRKEKGISQEKLIIHLRDRNDGSSVNRNLLSALENGKLKTERFPSKTIYAIADILNIDVNHLLGEQEHKSLDRHDISVYTGLSDEAIERLHDLSGRRNKRNNHTADFLNALILCPELWALSVDFDNYRIAKSAYDRRSLTYQECKEAFDCATMERIRNIIPLLQTDLESGESVTPEMVSHSTAELQKQKYTKQMHAAPLIKSMHDAEQSFMADIQTFLKMVGEEDEEES